MGATHVSLTSAGIKAIEEVSELGPEIATLCLHDNSLTSLAGLQAYTKLADLNLSSNRITSTDSISALCQLTALDLSNNLLRNADNLAELRSLKRLKLRHNQITSLSGLAPAGLEYLDVRDNRIHNLQQLAPLAGLASLQTLHCDLLEGRQQELGVAQNRAHDTREAVFQEQEREAVELTVLPYGSETAWPLVHHRNGWEQRQGVANVLPMPQVAIHHMDIKRSRNTCGVLDTNASSLCHLADAAVQTDQDLASERLGREANQLQHELAALRAQMATSTTHQHQAKRALDLCRREADIKVAGIRLQAAAALKAAQRRQTEAESRAQEAHNEAKGATSRLERAEETAEALRAELRAAKAAAAEAEAANQRLSTRLEDARDSASRLSGESASASQHFHQQIAHWQEGMAKLGAEKTGAEARCKQLEADLEAAGCSLQQRRQIEADLAASRTDRDAAKQEAELLRREREALQHAIAALHDREQLGQELMEGLQAVLASCQAASVREQQAQAAVLEAGLRAERCQWESREQRLKLQAEELQETVQLLQKQAAAAEARMRQTVQDSETELRTLQQERNQAAAVASDLRRALQTAAHRLKERDATATELAEAVQRLKSRVASLQAELAEAAAAVAAANPQQTARLQADVATLRETVGSLSAYKEQALRAQQHWQRLEGEVAEERRRRHAAEQLAARCSHLELDAERGRARITELEAELQDAQQAFKVKEAMVDSAHQTSTGLKAALAAAKAELAAQHKRLGDANEQRLSEMQAGLEMQKRALQAAQEAARAAQQDATSSDRRCCLAEAALQEREEMVRYVTEEVSRVKALFQEREAALTQERDSASHSSLAATQECAALSEKLSSLRSQLQAEKQASQKLADAVEMHEREAGIKAGRLAEVESEALRLRAQIDAQNAASAAKMQQLARVLQELQGS